MSAYAIGQPTLTQLDIQSCADQPTRLSPLDARQPPQDRANSTTQSDCVDLAVRPDHRVQPIALDPPGDLHRMTSRLTARVRKQNIRHGHNAAKPFADELFTRDSHGILRKAHREPVIMRPNVENDIARQGRDTPDRGDRRTTGGPNSRRDRVSADTLSGHTAEPTGLESGHDRGVVVMAYGARRFLRQAWHFVLSLRCHSPEIPVALVTDRTDDRLASVADLVIPFDGAAPRDCRPKLDLDTYSPFAHTLYLDADSLVVRDVRPLFDRFRDHEFVVLGRQASDGYWYGDVAGMCDLAGSDSLPKVNGGILYFARSARTTAIFATARELASQYEELGYDTFNGGVADEPLLAIALARHGIEAQPLEDSSVTPLGITSPLKINVLAGSASFAKKHRQMRPTVVHFAADFSARFRVSGSYYRRECLRLRLAKNGVTPQLAGVIAQSIHGIPCVMTNAMLRLRYI
jgi:hypothetical protein